MEFKSLLKIKNTKIKITLFLQLGGRLGGRLGGQNQGKNIRGNDTLKSFFYSFSLFFI